MKYNLLWFQVSSRFIISVTKQDHNAKFQKVSLRKIVRDIVSFLIVYNVV